MQRVFADVASRLRFRTDAWVILPDHMHVVWTLPEGDSDYSTRWAILKKDLTKDLRCLADADAASTTSRVRHRDGTVWQRRFWEHLIRDDDDLARHVDYVHYNPVKHGYVRQAIDWPFSSFHRFVERGWLPADWGCGYALDGDFGERR